MRRSPVAIVGMACRFPGAESMRAYADNILRGVSSIAPMPASRLNRELYYDPDPLAIGKTYSDLGGLVTDRPFDAAALGLSVDIVETTDPAHLHALEVAGAALEDAGLEPGQLRDREIAVWVGHSRGSTLSSDLALPAGAEGLLLGLSRSPTLGGAARGTLEQVRERVVDRIRRSAGRRPSSGVSASPSGLPALISRVHQLSGRHMVVDAACASSFAALDMGLRALESGAVDVALVGAASYSQELSLVLFAQSRALSPDGSFPFDRRAGGFISSDGYAFLVLKRLEDVSPDRDRVRALIRGIGSSSDGRGKALWAPRREGQTLAITRALEDAGVDPDSIGLLEAHATSTPLGDLTEVMAIDACFQRRARRGPDLPIGSVKGNIGHARESAGMAGLFKVVHALETGVLPPTGGFSIPSEQIPWSEVGVEVITAPRPFKSDGPRRAAVNAFGIGGLNQHVILEEAPPVRSACVVPAAIEAADPSSAEDCAPRPGSAVAAAVRSPRGRTHRALDVAIIGIGAKLPGGIPLDALASALAQRRSLSSTAPSGRWPEGLAERLASRGLSPLGGFVHGFEPDWRRYSLPPKLVEANDPLQFMVLDAALDALEDARVNLDRLDRRRVGVIVGSTFGSDYAHALALALRVPAIAMLVESELATLGFRLSSAEGAELRARLRAELPAISEDSSGSFSSSTLASRTAKVLDLMGPAYALDASCASGLVAIQAAAELLRSSDLELVLAGGGDRSMRAARYEDFSALGLLAPDDRTRPFGAPEEGSDGRTRCFGAPAEGSDGRMRPFGAPAEAPDQRIGPLGAPRPGLLPAEGSAMFALKRLEDAERDGDRIRGVLRGVGSAGECAFLLEKGDALDGLERAIVRAIEEASLPPDSVGYVEGHGLGSERIDRLERRSTARAYGARALALGSHKGSLGHAGGAAGALGLLAAVLAVERGEPLDPAPRTIAIDDLEPGPGRSRREASSPGVRVAGVSAVGLSGVSVHAIVEAHGSDARASAGGASFARPRGAVVRLRAADALALHALAGSLSAEALLEAREHGVGLCCASIAAPDAASLTRALTFFSRAGTDAAAEELRAKQGIFVRARPLAPPRVALLFSGQGSQYPGMMKVYVESVPAARALLARADAWAQDQGLDPISEVMLSGRPIPTELFSVQATVLLADLIAHAALESRGLAFDFVTGHSFGDYAALVVAGSFSLEDALDATRMRCAAIAATSRPGGMVSVSAGRDVVAELLDAARARGFVESANVNAPDQVVVAGEPDALDALIAVATARRIETVRLEIPRAFHSALMGEAQLELARSFARLELRPPALPYLSSVTGSFEDDPRAIRQALVEQLTRPVDFIRQIEQLLHRGVNVLVECGPRGVLASLGKRIAPPERGVTFLTVDDAQRPGLFSLARLEAAIDARRVCLPREDDELEAEAPTTSASIPSARAKGSEMMSNDEATLAITLPSHRAREPGFDAFWAEARAPIVRFVEALFEEERRSSGSFDRGPASSRVPVTGSMPSTVDGPPSPLRSLESVSALGPEGAGLADVDEVMRRHIIRAVVAPRPPAASTFRPGTALILGGSKSAEALGVRLSARGARVVVRRTADEALAAMTELGGPSAVDTIAIVLDDAPTASMLDAERFSAWRRPCLEDPFRLLRAYAPERSSGTVLGMTVLGGALGFENAADGFGPHGALLGMLKAIRREFPGLVVQALDASSQEPPAARADALVAELDRGPTRLEVGLCRGQRIELAMTERSAPLKAKTVRPLPESWLVTGGARGVTARLVERLAALYRPRLHLLGRHALPPEAELNALLELDAAALEALKARMLEPSTPGGERPSPKAWRARVDALEKSIEIGRNLAALRAHGSRVTYHAVDVADPVALAEVLSAVRREGRIEGLIHGAGVEVAKAFDRKTDSLFAETIGAKVDGLVHLLRLLEADAPTHVIGFSSVSGRFGGHGQVDYSLANEALARILSTYRARHPDRHVTVFSFPAFSEVGLATRSSSRLFLERAGQTFMTPAEGANHLIRELWSGLSEPEVTLADRISDLDLDQLLPATPEARARATDFARRADTRPLLGDLVSAKDRVLFERSVRASEPFLDQHRMGATPILPAVIALEALTELAEVTRGQVVRDLQILSPLKVSESSERVLRLVADEDGALRLSSRIERSDGVVLDPDRAYVVARAAPRPSADASRDALSRLALLRSPGDLGREAFTYPYPAAIDRTPGSHAIYHGPVFRVVEGIVATPYGGQAFLRAPELGAIVGPGASLSIPAALLDGCLQVSGMVGRIHHGLVALPAGFGAVHVLRIPAPGTRVMLTLVSKRADATTVVSDFVVEDETGPLFFVERYSAQALPA